MLEDEVRRLMELAKHSRNNESLLAEGTGLVSALTAQNGTLEGKVKTMVCGRHADSLIVCTGSTCVDKCYYFC